MVAGDSFSEFLREQLAPLGGIAMRRMFGKTGVFCEGLMLGLLSDDALYLRVDDGNRALFGEAAALGYERKGVPMELPYWRVPDRLYDDPGELGVWARAALAAARRASARRRRAKR